MKSFVAFISDCWTTIGLVLVLLILCEGAASIYYNMRTPSNLAVTSDTQTALALGPGLQEFHRDMPHCQGLHYEPFVQWRGKDCVTPTIHVVHGIRKTKNDSKHPVALKLFVLGGSTTWGFGASDDQTIPSHLSRELLNRDYPGVEVQNFGETGYVINQEIAYLRRQVQQGNIPDIVVFYDGINENLAYLYNHHAQGTQLDVELSRMWSVRKKVTEASLWDILERLSTVKFCQGLRRRLVGDKGLPNSLSAPISENPVAQDSGNKIVGSYLAAFEMAVAMGQHYGFEVYGFWQPTIHTVSALTKAESGIMDSARPVYGELFKHFEASYGAMRKAKRPENLFDLQALFAHKSETLFFDHIGHVTAKANAIVAEQMTDRLIQASSKLSRLKRKATPSPDPIHQKAPSGKLPAKFDAV